MDEEIKKNDWSWLQDRNSKFRSNFSLVSNIALLLLVGVFLLDYDAAKNSYQFKQAMEGIKDCQNYSYVYLILGHNNIDTMFNRTPTIMGFQCTNGFAAQLPYNLNYTGV